MGQDLINRNPIIDEASKGIEWSRGVDGDDYSKFAGTGFEPSAEVYSIKWRNVFRTYQGQRGPTARHDPKLDIVLTKEAEGTERDFKADLDLIYAIDWALGKTAIRNFQVSEGTVIQYTYDGRTDVNIYRMESENRVQSGECFRTTHTPGYCT